MPSNRQLFLDCLAQTSPSPLLLEIESAEGIYLYDRFHNSYIDLISGVNVSSVGHANPRVIRAVKQQVEKYMHVMVYGELVQSPQIQYAKEITSLLPENLESVYFTSSGSEAIEGAMKLAKRYTGRSSILSFRDSYHGSTHGAMSLTGSEYFKRGYRPLLPGIEHLEFNNFHELNRINEDTAAVVAEVMQAEAGMILPKEEFLKALRDKCDKTGTLLILDEIQTGLGRMGELFGFNTFEVIPDILVLSKSFGGGMPLGAFISSREIMEVLTFNPVLGHITTFGGHPVCCAAGLESLRILLEEDLIGDVARKETLFRSLLISDHIKEIRGKGLMLAVDLGSKEKMHKLVRRGLETGFMTDWFLFCETAFRISPPLTILDEEIKTACKLILDAIDYACSEG